MHDHDRDTITIDGTTGIPVRIAAERLNISRSRVHQLIKEDPPRLPATLTAIGYLIKPADLDRPAVRDRVAGWRKGRARKPKTDAKTDTLKKLSTP